MFSVIIPLYNKEVSFPSTLEPVLDQTYTDFEVVIVNDGSTDHSPKIAEECNDSRIRIIHQKNQGVSAARNTGIQAAMREWIVFLDADDLWKPGFLSTIREMIQQYPNDFVFSTCFLESNRNKNIEEEDSVSVIENYFTEAIHGHFFWTSATCLHQSVFDDIGYFDTRLTTGEDQELWARIGRKYRFIHSRRTEVIYRRDTENSSGSNFDLKKNVMWHYDFRTATSEEETRYYKRYMIRNIYYFLTVGKINIAWKIWQRHRRDVGLIDILKVALNRVGRLAGISPPESSSSYSCSSSVKPRS